MDAPKCRHCGLRHWGTEHPAGRVTAGVTAPVTARVTNVTKPVTNVTRRVVPTEAQMIEAAVHDQHECPICGRMHQRLSAAAEKQKAYRERKRQ